MTLHLYICTLCSHHTKRCPVLPRYWNLKETNVTDSIIGWQVGGYDLISLSRHTPDLRWMAVDDHGKSIGSACFASDWYDYIEDKFMTFINVSVFRQLQFNFKIQWYHSSCKSTKLCDPFCWVLLIFIICPVASGSVHEDEFRESTSGFEIIVKPFIDE